MERQYYVLGGLESDILQEFLALMSIPEYNYRSWFTWQDHEITLDMLNRTELNIAWHYLDEEETSVPYLLKDGEALVNGYLAFRSPEEGLALYEAICRDIQEGNMQSAFLPYFTSEGTVNYGNIQFYVYMEPYDESYGTYEIYRQNVTENYHFIELTDSMAHTLKALEEMGITLNPEALK